MKQGRSLTDLAKELERQKNAKVDYLVDTRSIIMDADHNGIQLTLHNEANGSNIILGVNEIAHDQIGTALGIPAKYYDTMREKAPDLLATNVNRWLKDEPERRLVRTMVYDDRDMRTVRAFLSDRYRMIDNWDVAQTSLETLFDIGGLKVESCEVTEQKMYIKVVNERLTAEVVPGDIVQSGMIITNSEVGKGSLAVQPLVYRLVCSNGMIVNEAATKRRHIGRGYEMNEDFTLYSTETMMLEDRALMAKVRDTVRAVADQTRFDKVVELMRLATGAKMDTDNVPALVQLAGSEFKYTQEEGKGILDHLIRGNDFSLYGLSNAVTRAAQDIESYDRSTEMESIGFDLLGMSAEKWARLNRESRAKTVVAV